METISVLEARRLALARAGLWKLEPPGQPESVEDSARRVCYALLERLGYVQLDTIAVAGARSHALVFLSRLHGIDPTVAADLLRPNAPLFEYWGHEASWIPMSLYPAFAFRRRDYRRAHPWWGPLLQEHRAKARAIQRRIRDEGPLRSADFEDRSPRNDWGFTLTKRLLHALWSSGDLAIRARPNFHRLYDLAERVIPETIRREEPGRLEAISTLVSRALEVHGWAETRTLAHTWRLPRKEVTICLQELRSRGQLAECALVTERGHPRAGWIRPHDLELAARLRESRFPRDRGVLLSPFDGLLWDRERVHLLFDFEHVLEVYKPAAKRRFGYYCMPVLAGDRLVARCDLKADRVTGTLQVLSLLEEPGCTGAMREATRTAIARLAAALRRSPTGLPSPRKAK